MEDKMQQRLLELIDERSEIFAYVKSAKNLSSYRVINWGKQLQIIQPKIDIIESLLKAETGN